MECTGNSTSIHLLLWYLQTGPQLDGISCLDMTLMHAYLIMSFSQTLCRIMLPVCGNVLGTLAAAGWRAVQ